MKNSNKVQQKVKKRKVIFTLRDIKQSFATPIHKYKTFLSNSTFHLQQSHVYLHICKHKNKLNSSVLNCSFRNSKVCKKTRDSDAIVYDKHLAL